jgi:hypothetical protein
LLILGLELNLGQVDELEHDVKVVDAEELDYGFVNGTSEVLVMIKKV